MACQAGGVFANSPGTAAATTALRSGHALASLRVQTVGTGAAANHLRVPPWDHVCDKTGGTRCGLLA